MSIIEPELSALKDNLLDMFSLVIKQIERCTEAIHKIDVKIAEEVIENEQRVNSQELAIDRDCENVLALHTPVAVDLRFVLCHVANVVFALLHVPSWVSPVCTSA